MHGVSYTKPRLRSPRWQGAQNADPKRFYDNSLVEDLQCSGYIDGLSR
jgi:hypothetical protein